MADENKAIPMWLHNFQLKLTDALGRLEEGQKGIHTRLDRLNGSVADHTTRLTEIELRNASRVFGCPLLNDIRKLTDGLSNQIEILQEGAIEVRTADNVIKIQMDKDRAVTDAIKAHADRWYKRLSPYIQWIIMAIAILLISHFSEIVKMIRGG